LITPITALNTVYSSFKTKVAVIYTTVKQQELQLTGVAEDKLVLRRNLAHIGNIVGMVVKAFAVSRNDNTLKAEVDFSESDLFKSRDETIINNCQTIYDRANTNLAQLGVFGITAAVMTSLQNALTSFRAKAASPTVARDIRAVATENLAIQLDEANTLLREQMDNNMKIFQLSNPDFWKLYRNARRIIDLGAGRSAGYGSIKGVVKETATGLVIEGALIELLDTDAVTSSDALGEFTIDAEPNTYSIRVSKDDYEEVEVHDIVVLKGEDVVVNVLLEILV
jgi:hypothetical protein